jgi:hypothetical protein
MRGNKSNALKQQNFMQDQDDQMDDSGTQNELNVHDLIVNTPPSDFGFNGNEDDEGEIMDGFDEGA